MIWQRTQTALATLAPLPVAANVFIGATPGTQPDQFAVYQLIASPPELHADNAEISRSYRMQVTYYSRAGLENLPDIAGAMTAAGFRRGPLRELPYNPATRHYGLAMEFVYVEDQE